MNPAPLILAASGALLLASARTSVASIEAGPDDLVGGFDSRALVDRAETVLNLITEAPADVDVNTADLNTRAFLQVLQRAEGTAGQADPYRVCYGYRYTIRDLRDHPTVTGEWPGEKLPDSMCTRAGFGPGCRSTAAGAYQIIRGTWLNLRNALGLPDFTPTSQDAAAVELIRRRGALEDVRAGRLEVAVRKCRNEWASLPGNYAGQGQRSVDQLAGWYQQAGGWIA